MCVVEGKNGDISVKLGFGGIRNRTIVPPFSCAIETRKHDARNLRAATQYGLLRSTSETYHCEITFFAANTTIKENVSKGRPLFLSPFLTVVTAGASLGGIFPRRQFLRALERERKEKYIKIGRNMRSKESATKEHNATSGSRSFVYFLH